MIVLDTNILSELLKPASEGRVTAWLEAWPRPSLFTTAITRQVRTRVGRSLKPDSSMKMIVRPGFAA